MRLLSVSEMIAREKAANAGGYSYMQMMAAAGKAIAEVVMQFCEGRTEQTALGLVGVGNNGGDTLIALTVMQQAGWDTKAILLKTWDKDEPLLQQFTGSGGEILNADALMRLKDVPGVVLDGLFGTGFRLPLPDKAAGLLSEARQALSDFLWVAVDCPSGMDCGSGEVSSGTIKADLTICLEAVKAGIMTYSAFPFIGELKTADLGISQYLGHSDDQDDIVIDASFVRKILPIRDDFSHKGSHGTLMVIGGCTNYPGAPVLAGEGAYAVGTGLVKVGIPSSVFHHAASTSLELTWVVLEDGGGVISELAVETALPFVQSAQCLVLGPGIGREDTTRKFIQELIISKEPGGRVRGGFPGMSEGIQKMKAPIALPPMVIDADALTLLSTIAGWAEKIPSGSILTPHPGEMARLTGLSIDEVQRERAGVARKFAALWQQVVVLKGALTVIAAPNGRTATIPAAASSLAKAGTGDVLAGMIGGLAAQGLDAWQAAIAGAWLHARAGIEAVELVGCSESVLASDVISAIPLVYHSLK